MTDTPTPDEETGVPAGDDAHERSPDVETSGSDDPRPDHERRVDPDSPGETLDDDDIAEPNEPG